MLPAGRTEAELEVRHEHFPRLQRKHEEGVVRYIGIAQRSDDSTLATVFLPAESEAEARDIMRNDPGVKHRLQTGTLIVFRTVFGGIVVSPERPSTD